VCLVPNLLEPESLPRTTQMRERVVFRAAGQAYSREDVLRAAEFRGELEPIRNAMRGSLVCRAYAQEQGFEPDPEELQSATEAYRYENDLTTAEETEQWLEENDLTLDDFGKYFERHYCSQRFSSLPEEIRSDYEPSPADVENLIWQEVLLGNHFPRFVQALAWRVAAALEEAGEIPPASSPDELSHLEARLSKRLHQILTDDNYRRELRANPLGLVQFEVESASFASPESAGEAFLCVTQDGETLGAVALRAGSHLETCTHFVEGLPPDLQQRAYSSVPGETLPPLQEGEVFRIYRIRKKIDPDLNDPKVRERLKKALLMTAFEDLVRKHIVWSCHIRGN
jgi:hypothetical protein